MSEKVDAIILAGGTIEPDLKEATGVEFKALVPVAGRPMVAWLMDALRESNVIDRIVVVGPKDVLEALEGVEGVEERGSFEENLSAGLEACQAEDVLVVPCDIPLLSPSTVHEFVLLYRRREVELAYAAVPRGAVEARFPGVRRTYARLREGAFTGGNMVVARREVLGRIGDIVSLSFSARKSLVGLARLLGIGFVLKFVVGLASLADIEARAAKVLGAPAAAIVLEKPDAAMDVDSLEHLRTVEGILASRVSQSI